MASDFKMKVSAQAGAVKIRLQGMVSEIVELDTTKVPAGQPVVIDAGEIDHMNSLGVRNWIDFLKELCAKSPEVIIERLSPIMVFQASMITTFLARARVVSYLAPWVCVDCDHYTMTAHALQEDLPPSMGCPKCKRGTMELDSDVDAYQTFRQMAMAQG